MRHFATYAILSALTAVSSVAFVLALPLDEAQRSTGLLGVALSGASGGLALVLKRRAIAHAGLSAALTALAVMFGVRGLLLGAGLWSVVRANGPELAFVLAFFGVYVLQQVIELAFVVAASKKLKGVSVT